MKKFFLTSQEFPDWYQKIDQFIKSQKIDGPTPSIDEFNIPVEISFRQIEKMWELSWYNYMPRKQTVWHEPIVLKHPSRVTLAEFIKLFIKPLYAKANDVLDQIIDGKDEELYAWWN